MVRRSSRVASATAVAGAPVATRTSARVKKIKEEQTSPAIKVKQEATPLPSAATVTKRKSTRANVNTPQKGAKKIKAETCGLKGVAGLNLKNGDGVSPGLDEGFLAQEHAMNFAEVKRDARLVRIDPTTNSDSYYLIQVIKSGRKFMCWQRWGRTGTAGQGRLMSGSQAKMIAEFEDKFEEKTGVAYQDALDGDTKPIPGKYEWLSLMTRAQALEQQGEWEYYVDDFVDGKPTGWYPYDECGSKYVEEIYRDRHVAQNVNMSVRFVESGHWTYRVDLGASDGNFTQTNTSTNKTRVIRRIVNGTPTTQPSSPATAIAKPQSAALKSIGRNLSNALTGVTVGAQPVPAALSTEIPIQPSCAGYVGSGTKVHKDYDATLNQTDIKNNNNKFYYIQLLVDLTGDYFVFTAWGRVGEPPKTQFQGPFDETSAIAVFEKKFSSKTGNRWGNRSNFAKMSGKYDLILTKVSTNTNKPAPNVKGEPVCFSPSKLDVDTQEFIRFIFDKDMFKESMAELDIDVDKMPLGALSEAQVQHAYDVLNQLEDEVNGRARQNALTELSSRYYTLIPHNFGRRRPPVINSQAMVQKEYDLVNVIGDIEKAQSIIKESDEKQAIQTVNPLDAKFDSLKMEDWEVVAPKSDLFRRLNSYALASKGYRKMRLQKIFKVGRENEDSTFKQYDGLDRMLLWHGTNVAVVAAILKSGLRIMPHSGGRVGAGIYLATEHSKSSGYTSGARWKGHNLGVMFLVEAAVGKSKIIHQDDPRLKAAPKGFDSVLAKGCQSPMGTGDEFIEIDGRKVTIPAGAINPTGVQSSFTQDEMLIYNEKQHRLRFVLVFEM